MKNLKKLSLTIILILIYAGLSNSLVAQNHRTSVIIGGMSDFKEGGIISLGVEVHSLFPSTNISPVIFLAHDFTRESWDDQSKGNYRAYHIGAGLRLASKESGYGLLLEPQLTYSHLLLQVRQEGISNKSDSGNSFGLGFLYGYRFKMLDELLFIEPALYGGINFADITLATDPFPYNRKPKVIDWHSWNNPSEFSLVNTFLVRIGMQF